MASKGPDGSQSLDDPLIALYVLIGPGLSLLP